MPSLKTEREWLRAGVAQGIEKGASGVDRDGGSILGFSVITKGEARGHGMEIDGKTLDQVVELGNRASLGLKSRFGHPNMSNDALGTFLGRVTNFRRDGDRVRADLKLDETAYKTPKGNLADYVLRLGESDPNAFATSVVVAGKREPRLEADGTAKKDPMTGEDMLPLLRVKQLLAVDVVDEGAANQTMFGAEFFAPGVELSAAATAALDQLLDRPDAVDKVISFLERYSSRREAQEPEEHTQKETPMAETKKDDAVATSPEERTKIYTEAFAAGRSEGEKGAAESAKSAAAEAVKAERARISKIRSSAFSGQEDLVAKAIDEGLSTEAALDLFISGEKASNKARLGELRRDKVPALGVNHDPIGDLKTESTPGTAELKPGEYDEVKLTAVWESDETLRSEFMHDKKVFFAFKKNEALGRIKLGAKK